MAITQPVGYPFSSSSNSGVSSVAFPATQQIGDEFVLAITTGTTAYTITSISDTAGQVSTWSIVYQSGSTGQYYYVVRGTVAANPGVTTTVNIAWSSTNSTFTDMAAYCLHPGISSPTWGVVATGGTTNASSTSVTFPTLVSNAVALQAYIGFAFLNNSWASGATPAGFTSWNTSSPGLDLGIYDLSLATNTGYTPTGQQTPASTAASVGVILSVASVPSYAPRALPRSFTAVSRAANWMKRETGLWSPESGLRPRVA